MDHPNENVRRISRRWFGQSRRRYEKLSVFKPFANIRNIYPNKKWFPHEAADNKVFEFLHTPSFSVETSFYASIFIDLFLERHFKNFVIYQFQIVNDIDNLSLSFI